MPRMERERRFYLHTSGDWGGAPAGFEACRGVLVTRTAPGEYALYMNGRWRRYRLLELQTSFDFTPPPGLAEGFWGIVPRVWTRTAGSYQDHFTPESLIGSLARASADLYRIEAGPKRNVLPGLNKGLRATVAI